MFIIKKISRLLLPACYLFLANALITASMGVGPSSGGGAPGTQIITSEDAVNDYVTARSNKGSILSTCPPVPLPTYVPSSSANVVIAQSLGVDPSGIPLHQKLSSLAVKTSAEVKTRTVDHILNAAFNNDTVINSTTIIFNSTGISGSPPSIPVLTNAPTTAGGGGSPAPSPSPAAGATVTITAGARLITLLSPTSNDDNFYLSTPAERLGLLLQAVFGISSSVLSGYTGGSLDSGVVLTTVLDGVFGGTGNRTSTSVNNPVFGGTGTNSSPSGYTFGNIIIGGDVATYYSTYANNDDTQFLKALLNDLVMSTQK